jgi:hypothetical protein
VYPRFPTAIHLKDDDSFRLEFGFVVKTVNTKQAVSNELSEKVWETEDDWMDRNGKILGVFAEIVALNSSAPFNLMDGWTWLAHMVNLSCSQYVVIDEFYLLFALTFYCSKGNEPFYVAESLDIFLRITAEAMMKQFGQQFIKVLKMIQNFILPKLFNDNNRKTKNSIERLTGFLESALGGRYPVFLPMVSVKT